MLYIYTIFLNVNFMKFKLNSLLCWIGIHRYKIIDASFAFSSQNPIKTIQCKICGIKKIVEKK
mgnify:FL=1